MSVTNQMDILRSDCELTKVRSSQRITVTSPLELSLSNVTSVLCSVRLPVCALRGVL